MAGRDRPSEARGAAAPGVSGATYNAVWDGLLEVARARRYFAAQERRLERLVNALRFVLALSGVGAVASLVDSRLKVANVELAGLETGYRSFWEKTRNGAFSDGEAQSMKDEMLDALNRIAAHVDVTPNDSIVLRTQDAAFTAEERRYAV